MIKATCPHCGKRYRLVEKFAGRKATCKACQKPFLIPEQRSPISPATSNESTRSSDDSPFAFLEDVKRPAPQLTPPPPLPPARPISVQPTAIDDYKQLPWHRRGVSWRLLAFLGTFAFMAQLAWLIVSVFDGGALTTEMLAAKWPGPSVFVVPVGLACMAGPIYHKPRATEQQLEPWPAWTRPFFIAMSLFVVLQLVLGVAASLKGS